ncbi:hypothetical protein LSM04_001754 [Trypanosoma melophagium]|uniref:uncharacterized protein n=1 Tax=Trypanosoma melophagium TaxID=715481 RepID=UPI003519E7E5|nr:hypothetical protein LSM04_001754 [Trypanosoma melophagium]
MISGTPSLFKFWPQRRTKLKHQGNSHVIWFGSFQSSWNIASGFPSWRHRGSRGKTPFPPPRLRDPASLRRLGAKPKARLKEKYFLRTSLQDIAIGMAETNKTSPLEKVPDHVRFGEVKGPFGSPIKTARPSRDGNFVDLTRCGDFQKKPGPDAKGRLIIWQLNVAGLSSLKKAALSQRLSLSQPGIALLQETKNRSTTATKISGYYDFHHPRSGRGGGVAILIRHGLQCEQVSLPDARSLEAIALLAFAQASPPISLLTFCNPPPALALVSHSISIILRLDPHALVAGAANLDHDTWENRLPSSKDGEKFATTLLDFGFEVANDPSLATRIDGNEAPSPDVSFSR